MLVVTVLVFASQHLLSCLLVGTVLVSASHHVCWWVLFWCLLAVTCCHVTVHLPLLSCLLRRLLFSCLLATPVVMSVGGYCSRVC